MKIYLAAPVSKETDRAINSVVASMLKLEGFTVLLPQEIGVAPLMAEEYVKKGLYSTYEDAYKAAQEECWDRDVEAMNEANLCFVNLTRPASEGTCAEIGYMTALHKPVIGIRPYELKVGTVLTRTVKWQPYAGDVSQSLIRGIAGCL